MKTGTYLVFCPALGTLEYVESSERANDVCYEMHVESGGNYAWAEDYLGHTHIEYGDH